MSKKIYGIMQPYSKYGNGHQCHAIDGDTGETIESHFCSNEGWGKADLGFSMNENTDNSKRRNKKYTELYPDGYELEWVGLYQDNEKMKELVERGKKEKKEKESEADGGTSS